MDTPQSLSSLEDNGERQRLVTMGLADALKFNSLYVAAVIYSSELVRTEFERAFQMEVEKLNWRAKRLIIENPDPEEADIPLRLKQDPDRHETVFFVSGFRWGAPTSYNALNFRREYFFEERLRVIFWLTQTEAHDMAERAPDFWQIPNPVIELLDQPAHEQIQVVELEREEFFWPELDADLLADPQAIPLRLEWRINLLRGLEQRKRKTIYTHAHLEYTLAALRWSMGQLGLAAQHINKAHRLAKQIAGAVRLPDPNALLGRSFLAAVLCGRGNIALTQNHASSAEQDFRTAAEKFGESGGWLGLGHVYRVQKRFDEALHCYQLALSSNPSPHLAWRGYFSLGQLYFAMRQLEPSLQMFDKAVELKVSKLPRLGVAKTQEGLGQIRAAQQSYWKIMVEGTSYRDKASEAFRQLEASVRR